MPSVFGFVTSPLPRTRSSRFSHIYDATDAAPFISPMRESAGGADMPVRCPQLPPGFRISE